MDSLGQKLAMMLQQQGQQSAQMPQGMQQFPQGMPQMPMMQQMTPPRMDPYGQQQTGVAQALMRGLQYGRT